MAITDSRGWVGGGFFCLVGFLLVFCVVVLWLLVCFCLGLFFFLICTVCSITSLGIHSLLLNILFNLMVSSVGKICRSSFFVSKLVTKTSTSIDFLPSFRGDMF